MSDYDREAEIRALTRYAEGLGFCEATVRIVYEAVTADASIARTNRVDEVRRRLLNAAMASLCGQSPTRPSRT